MFVQLRRLFDEIHSFSGRMVEILNSEASQPIRTIQVKDNQEVKEVTLAKRPGAPKRPPSAYLLYVQQVRQQTVQDNPRLSFSEIGSLLGRQWNSMSQTQKSSYEIRATRLREEYKQALTKFGEQISSGAGQQENQFNNNKESAKNNKRQIENQTENKRRIKHKNLLG